MMSSPEAAKFILVTRADIFKPTFPASKERMLGRQAIFFQQGKYHAQLRRLVLRAVMPNVIRSRVAEIDAVALSTVSSWEGRTVNTFEEMKTVRIIPFIFDLFPVLLVSQKTLKQKKTKNYHGLNLVPLV